MGDMEMPAPDNTLPMMTGSGQFDPIERGGMFTVMKIRDGLTRNDCSDPRPYRFPTGAMAYEIDATAAEPPRQPSGDAPAPSNYTEATRPMPMKGMNMKGM